MYLAENFRFDKNASIAFDWSNANRLSPNPYNKQKRENESVRSRNVLSFSVSDVFAIAKVMLFASLIMMLLAKARNDVMFAHYAVRRNIIHAVNITAAGNIICP